MKIIKPTFPENHLSEIDQTVKLLFSWASVNGNKVQRLHEWCKCRDFLGDVLWANKYNVDSDINIYRFYPKRFSWNGEPSFVIRFPSKTTRDVFFTNIHTILGAFGKKPATFTKITQLQYLVQFDEWWMQTIPQLSFFTFLFKVSCYPLDNAENWMVEIKDKYKYSVEARYIGSFMPDLVKNLDNIFNETPSITGWESENTLSIYSIHDSSGFYSLFSSRRVNNYYSKKFYDLIA